jgi:hypothetical protein
MPGSGLSGCDRVQGFLVTRARSAEGMDAFLQARSGGGQELSIGAGRS